MPVVHPKKEDPRSVLLVPTDLSEGSRSALKLANRLAKDAHVRLEVIHVVDLKSGVVPLKVLFQSAEEIEAFRQEAVERVEAFVAETIGLTEGLDLRVLIGHPVDHIVAAAEEEHVSLVVMGSTGANVLSKVMFGTTASRVMRRAKRPVLVVPPDASELHARRILIPYDFSEDSERALKTALAYARELKATILLYHAVVFVPVTPFYPSLPVLSPHLVEAQRKEARTKMEAIAKAHRDFTIEVLEVEEVHSLHHAIVEAANTHHADIIMLATSGREGVEHVVGSTTERVLREATYPVLVC